MMKKMLFMFVAVLSLTAFAQQEPAKEKGFTVSGKLTPKGEYKWVILNQLQGPVEKFKGSATLEEDGSFSIELKADFPEGIYRLLYDEEKRLYVDFLYNKENIELSFDPLNAEETIVYSKSKENKIYTKYLNEIAPKMYAVDKAQNDFFTADATKKPSLVKSYVTKLANLNKKQALFEKQSAGTLANFYIKSNKMDFPAKPYEDFQAYFDGVKANYFNNIDFNDKRFLNSNFLIDKVNTFVLYLITSDDTERQRKVHKNAIDLVLEKTASNSLVRSQILTSLIVNFVQTQDIVINDYLVEKYKQLPQGLQKPKFLEQVDHAMRLAVGRKAPDFSWYDGIDQVKLSTIDNADYYVIVFWSTQCSHCVEQIPELHKFSEDKEGLQVIAVALELDDAAFFDFRDKLPNFINILGLEKWDNEIAKKYDVHETPTYFIVDNKEKKIVAKPYDLKELKTLFKQVEVEVPAEETEDEEKKEKPAEKDEKKEK